MSAKFRYGIISEKDSTKGLVRVHFDDDNIVSGWIPYSQKSTLANKEFDLPDVNSHVWCIMDSGLDNGVCAGCIYSEVDTVPSASGDDITQYLFSDGSSIQYDRSAHKYTLNIVGGDIDIITNHDLNVTCENANVKANTKVTIDAPSAEFTGDVTIDGKATITGDATLSGKIEVSGKATFSDDITSSGTVKGTVVKAGTVGLGTHVHPVTALGSPTGPGTG